MHMRTWSAYYWMVGGTREGERERGQGGAPADGVREDRLAGATPNTHHEMVMRSGNRGDRDLVEWSICTVSEKNQIGWLMVWNDPLMSWRCSNAHRRKCSNDAQFYLVSGSASRRLRKYTILCCATMLLCPWTVSPRS